MPESVVKLIALLPLLIVLVILVKRGVKSLPKGSTPMSDENKDDLREAGKGIAYTFAAASLLWWFTPAFGWGLAILWTILTALFAVVILLSVIDLPTPKYNRLHNRLWKDGRKTPVYSYSGEPVEHIRWARRLGLVLLMLIAGSCLLIAALGTTSSDDSGKAAPADKPATSSVPSTSASAPAPSASATPAPSSATSVTFKNECGGADPQEIPSPQPLKEFGTGSTIKFCKDGDWMSWNQAFPGQQAPKDPLMTHWSWTDQKKQSGYGVVVINGAPYVFYTIATTTD